MNIYNKLAVLARKHKGKAHTGHNTAVCADGGALCAGCLAENYKLILRNTKDYAHGEGNTAADCKQWAIVDTENMIGETCANCYNIIEG